MNAVFLRRTPAIGPIVAACAVAAALGVSGCGGRGGGATTSTSEKPPEQADPPAKLPPGWQPLVNAAGGFSAGVPPQWTAKEQNSSSLLTSPDALIAVSIAGDRSDEALASPLESFASEAAAHLTGFTKIKAEAPRPFRARYPAVGVAATGTRTEGNRERLRLIVMRPDSIAVFTILAATTARIPQGKETKVIERIARTVRHRPVELGP